MANGPTVPPSADSKLPVVVSLALVAVGLVIGIIGGFTEGSWAGGIIAGLGVIPAMVGLWKGVQQENQTTLGLSVLAVLVSLGVGGVLIALKLVDYVF
jgi:hypothetical protein